MTEEDLKLYRGFLAERDQEIKDLRIAIVKYGDRIRMANANPQNIQQAIDRAFENLSQEEINAATATQD